MKKRILGLDLGTNSIGWALVEIDHEQKIVRIIALGSRILPMDAGEISKFESGGKLQSSAAARTVVKSTRKNISRFLLRRDRLHCVLNLLGMLPEHYKLDIEFVNEKGKRSGKFKKGKEPKLAYYSDGKGQSKFYFEQAYKEMEAEFRTAHPELFYEKTRGKKHIQTRIPYDWTLYYLRKKGLTKELSKEELAWVTMSFLQKRGYEKVMGLDEKEQQTEDLSEITNAKVVSVELLNAKSATGLNKYHIVLADEYENVVFEYEEDASFQITQKDEFKQIEKISRFDKNNDEVIKSVDVIISEIKNLEIIDVINTHEKKKEKTAFEIKLSSGWDYEYLSQYAPKIKGDNRDFIISTCFDQKGGFKKRSIKMPSEDDWQLEKLKTETSIENFNLKHNTCGVASYIYDALLRNPKQKIKAGLVTTIERDFYEKELKKILDTQKAFHDELKDVQKYQEALCLLYPNNETHRNTLEKQDFSTLLSDDIIFYQRDLKTKKALIKDCPYEEHIYWDKDTGEKKSAKIKCIAKSNPLYQEFRLWQFIKRLRIIKLETDNERGEKLVNQDVTDSVLTMAVKQELFGYLNNKKEITQETLLKKLFHKKGEYKEYKWNFEEDHKEPCNETRYDFVLRLKRIKDFDCEQFLDARAKTHEPDGKKQNSDALVDGCTNEYLLWHFFYSVKKHNERISGLPRLVEKLLMNANIDLSFKDKVVEMLSSISTYKNEYGTYSEKAIKKLLPLMRIGKYWSLDNIDANTKERIGKIITGEYDENIKNRVREKAINLTEFYHFSGLPVWLACYIVYGRHSEAKEIDKWGKPEDIDDYLKQFKQHSLRNPIVEQVVTETLRVVRDIWKQEGQIDEIHLELGREMKNPADKRKRMTERILQNENTNLRIKAMLMEFQNPEMGIENVRPYSPSQQDILRIYEENALENLSKDDDDFDFVSKMSKTAQPSKSDIIRYKCWLEQKYRSPYTGEMIPLAKLFTSAYEIEHVIPQSRYFDDSFSNKVICEAEVNKLKDRLLGFEFIKKHNGEKVQISQGKTVEILSIEAYEKFVKEHYANNRAKMKKLLMDDIPDGFIERQLNDSRYISKLVKGLLSNIVREKLDNGEYEQEAVSKNLISCNGSITDRLKMDWGMNDVWNSIILPRFQRLNELTGKDCFTTLNAEGHEIPAMPLELQRGFNKKRIDHRHHAMDAIVIACTTRDHVNLLNNEAAHSKYNANRYQLQRKLRRFEKKIVDGEEREIAREFMKPWDTFAIDAKRTLENIIVSFKQNLRVINKTTNHYQHYDANGKKVLVKQKKGDNSWAIRKSMHKDTVFGEVNLRFVKQVSLNEAIKRPKSIVHKEFKKKVLKLLEEGRDAKYIKKYVDDNKDVWTDIDVNKIDVYYFTKETNDRYFATRKPLDTTFDRKKIEGSVTDTGVQKILLAHLDAKGGDPELAFSPDGIDEMNRNIVKLNNDIVHQPISKVRVYEKAEKFAVGQRGNKVAKFVEAAKGTNLFFAVFGTEKMNTETGETGIVRSYLTIPLNVMIDCQKKYGAGWRKNIEAYLKDIGLVSADAKRLFILSPNDLVYLPKEDDAKEEIEFVDKSRIYKFIDPNGDKGAFVPFSLAKVIFSMKFSDQAKLGVSYPIQDEVGVGWQASKNSRAITGEMIKEMCIPIKVDRIGNIIELNGNRL